MGLTREDVMTVADAAKLLGISTSGAYKLARAGELPGARRLGARWLVFRPALEAFLRGDEIPPVP
ncbi:helix-turn-helix domain-containing protein [Patulibacter sp. SYSU D01012]|uniref:helix-turn-helix domain-containing protein n=1 Tax=Patulibacter sp. SYSU D01012 TaxID=2817381 RepID=UPI001B3186DC|nr:helix-turn-helix domain-containing protein [Patulibacter sp. SYSU D01012]